MDIRHSRLIKTIYEAPYRVRMYRLSKKLYREKKASMTPQDIGKIEKYKCIHKGERCFIVLTGPSLNENDLGLIKNEICFTVNSGYKAYGINGWKPWYYVSMDGNEVAQEMLQSVLDGDYDYRGIFTDMGNPIDDERLIKLPSDVSLIFRMNSILNKIFLGIWTTGRFSPDISNRIYTGKTVLFSAFQIAVHMGFSKIYLLGADFDYSGERTHSGLTPEVIKAKNVNWGKKEEDMMSQMRDFALDAKKKKICIYNATRGGRLDCFERVNLEDLFDYGDGY